MELNGKVAEIGVNFMNSLSVMIVSKPEGSEVRNEYLGIDTEITYKPPEGPAIQGFVKSYKSMMSIDNILTDVPLGSVVARDSDGFEGLTILTEDNNIDIMYDANDFQDHTSLTNFDGFENTKDSDITVEGQMGINIVPQRGVIDGLSFTVGSNVTKPIEAGAILPRIDLVLLRKDQINRTIEIIVRKGVASSTPTLPTIEQTPKGVYELPIYRVYVNINQTVLSRLNITDMRNPMSKENTVTKSDMSGCMQAYAGDINKIPDNALFCDGREISRTTYARLFDKLGIVWGAGNGTTTFNLPDGRAGVLKGSGTGSKFTHNENRGDVGTYQDTAIRNITGAIRIRQHISDPRPTGAFIYAGTSGEYAGGGGSASFSTGFDASQVVPVGETNRDNNIAVNWIIFI